MESLVLESTEFTPKVELNTETLIFEIAGVTMPEDASAFYWQILDWLNEYYEHIAKKSTGINNILRLNFRLTYCNSASAKFLLSIMEKLKTFRDLGIDFEISWYYDAGDDLMLEDGRDLSEALNMSFNFHPVVK
jgi:hypothetical protein